MFKTFRARVGILSLSRLPLSVHSAVRRDAVPVEGVRFMRARPRLKTVIASFVLYSTLCMTFTTVVFSPLEKLAADEEKAEEMDEQVGSIFIPFPGTTKQVQPAPYRGTDPEWQEYVKFSKDPALGKRIRDELAAFIQETVEKYPVLTQRCGKNIKLRRYWLDIDFPPIPPPEFERSGLEITDDDVGWTTMPVDSLTVFRIRQALWPSALTQSLWSFSKVLFWDDPSAIGGTLRTQTKSQSSVDPFGARSVEQSPTQPGGPNQPAEETRSPSTARASRTIEKPARTDPNAVSDESLSKQLEDMEKKIEAVKADINRIKTAPKEIEDDSTSLHPLFWKAYSAFKTKFAQTWRPVPSYPPRGSIIVSGMIELDAPKAWLVLDVRAAWDPKTRQYDTKSIHLAMRRLQMKRQAPLIR